MGPERVIAKKLFTVAVRLLIFERRGKQIISINKALQNQNKPRLFNETRCLRIDPIAQSVCCVTDRSCQKPKVVLPAASAGQLRRSMNCPL
jgi:hypothetical protein